MTFDKGGAQDVEEFKLAYSKNIESRSVRMTYGEQVVGTFNPIGDPDVEEIKFAYAKIINRMDKLRNSTESAEVKRMASIAITEAQTAQMWAVKAVTWKD